VNVILFGATGAIGQSIAVELVARGHTVTGISRSEATGAGRVEGVNMVRGDATAPDQVAKLTSGYDAVISATGPRHDGSDDPAAQVAVATALVEGLRAAGTHRLIVVGGAGSLEVAPGVTLVSTPEFPAAWRAVATGAAEALAYYRSVDDLEWTYISPAALIEPGDRTGTFRVGADQLLVDEAGVSRISIDDFAIGVVDELEQRHAIRRRITLAY
jgi:putative NADH-flavin reductase